MWYAIKRVCSYVMGVTLVNEIDKAKNVILNNAKKLANGFDHLSSSDKALFNNYIDQLFYQGHISIEDTNDNRYVVVHGIQYAMEQYLNDNEFIITPDLPTPFRKYDSDINQNRRKEGLMTRVDNGRKLHLIYCQDGTGTAEEYKRYQETIEQNSSYKDLIKADILPFSKEEFPKDISGAVIFHKQENTDDIFAFIIFAAQVDKRDSQKKFNLYFGKVNKNANKISSFNDIDRHINEQLGIIEQTLQEHKQFKPDFALLN